MCVINSGHRRHRPPVSWHKDKSDKTNNFQAEEINKVGHSIRRRSKCFRRRVKITFTAKQ